jgi:amino acid efflux transporter
MKGSLGLWQAVALYVGAVVGTGILVLPAIAAETAGPASLLAWAGLVILSLPLALVYAALSRERPDAAGFSGAVERAFGPRWGGAAGWIFLAQVPTGAVIPALIAGQYAASLVGGGRQASFALGEALVALAFLLNAAGLRVSARAQLFTVGAIAAGMTLVVARTLGRVDLSAFVPFAPHGGMAVGVAALQLFWAFVGWEAVTPLAADFGDPRDIWRASLIAVVFVGLLYVSLAIATIGTRAYGRALTGAAPLVAMTAATFGPTGAILVGLAGFVLSFAPLNAYTAGTGRLICALARRRQLPRWLGETSRSGAPRRALAALGVLCAVAATCAYAAGWRIADLLPLSTSSFIATYVLSMAAAVRLLRPPLQYAAAIALIACVLVLVFSGPLLAWIGGVAGCSLGYQWLAAARARGRCPVPSAAKGRLDGAASAEQNSGDVVDGDSRGLLETSVGGPA